MSVQICFDDHNSMVGTTVQPAEKKSGSFMFFHVFSIDLIPSREVTYPTCGKGTSSSKVPLKGDMLVPRGYQ